MSTGPQAAAMISARRSDSQIKRARVLATVEQLLAAGQPISYAAVARAAAVSSWLVYAPGVRETIHAAKAQQAADSAHNPDPAVTAGAATDLALARDEISRLRAEHAHHQQQLRLALGTRLDNVAKAELLDRVDDLTRRNTELAGTVHTLTTEVTQLRARTVSLEDDLAAARDSLRRMIRTENRLENRSESRPDTPTGSPQ